jgi:PQQ-like domain
MKIQCACGTKVAFDVTPDMATTPVRFVCPNCGLDSSEMVNRLILQELSSATQTPDISPAPLPVQIEQTQSATPAPDEPATPPARARIHIAAPAQSAETESQSVRLCSKHLGQPTTHECVVCKKPICPKCMELFGYVCSPHCKNKAELQGIHVPFYAGQKSVVERRHWRKVSLGAGAVAAVFALVMGVWIWYHFFASRPGVIFSERFEQPAFSGKSILTPDGQIVFLHGGTLARADIKKKTQLWSRDLLDHKAIAASAAAAKKEMELSKARHINQTGEGEDMKIPSEQELVESTERAAAAALELYVSGQNIWVASPEKIARYDWNTGDPAREIQTVGYGGAVATGNELVASTLDDAGRETVVHINLATGEAVSEPSGGTVGAQAPSLTAAANAAPDGSGLNPERIAADASRKSLPERLALPATLSVARNQQRALDELNSQNDRPRPTTPVAPAQHKPYASVVPSRNGDIEFTTLLLEEKIVARNAMKAPPKKSALNGATSVNQTTEVANEILNDMQRDRGADTVEEDESRYQVTLHTPGVQNATDWQGEVVGPPSLFALDTVNVLSAGKTIIVFDKFNKRLWESTLAYAIPEFSHLFGQDDPTSGQGPVVERSGTLYVFDPAVLTAFDLATGEARWRLPSVGISALFFDNKGMIYANTTTASPEKIKYSRQIDIGEHINDAVMKIDPAAGKILWNTKPGGAIRYLSGDYIYTLDYYQRTEEEEQDDGDSIYRVGAPAPSYMRIRRIDPANGKVMWEHCQKRAPLDVRFDKNTFHIVFKKEVQVLKFMEL